MNRYQIGSLMVLLTISGTGSAIIMRYMPNPFVAIIAIVAWVCVLFFIYSNSIIKPYYMKHLGAKSIEVDVPDDPNDIVWGSFPRQRGESNDWESNE